MAGRLVHRVTPKDIGRRATVRVQLSDGRFRDIVGVLESWEDGVIQVRRRDDTVARVIEKEIVASKIVPQQPPRRRTGL
ncbi:hypothetical protein GCM10022402_21390 [Salinactinospora qingdaonensis]|uniref:Ferrous iron transport protein A n=1 Tax=Salinactinospora qingdaonensis TaxID=702744 RepID=A0ABP7FJZ6_9ACTN